MNGYFAHKSDGLNGLNVLNAIEQATYDTDF